MVLTKFQWNTFTLTTAKVAENTNWLSFASCTPHSFLFLLSSFPLTASSSVHLLPCWTPLPLLPKAASVEWAWLADITLTPVSAAWGRGEREGRRRKEHKRGGSLHTTGLGSFSATHCFVIVPMAFCPHWSAGKAVRRGWSYMFRASHTLTLSHTRFDMLGLAETQRKCVSSVNEEHTPAEVRF